VEHPAARFIVRNSEYWLTRQDYGLGSLPPETLKRLLPYPQYTPEQTRAITRLWQKFKTGQ